MCTLLLFTGTKLRIYPPYILSYDTLYHTQYLPTLDAHVSGGIDSPVKYVQMCLYTLSICWVCVLLISICFRRSKADMHDNHPASCCSVLIELHWNQGFDMILQDVALIVTSMWGMSSQFLQPYHNYTLYSSYT